MSLLAIGRVNCFIFWGVVAARKMTVRIRKGNCTGSNRRMRKEIERGSKLLIDIIILGSCRSGFQNLIIFTKNTNSIMPPRIPTSVATIKRKDDDANEIAFQKGVLLRKRGLPRA